MTTCGPLPTLAAMDDPYAVDAQFYDAVHGAGGEDLDFWVPFAREAGRPVLEIGAGTGRIALALARAGHAVTGVDASGAMLRIARERAVAEGLDATFVEGRVPGAELPEARFAAALLPNDVFLYCADAAEQLATLRSVCGALAPGGRVAIDVPGPAHWLDPAEVGEPILAFSGESEGGRLDVWHHRTDDLAEQTRSLCVVYERTLGDGTVTTACSHHRLRYVTRFELKLLLPQAGLRVLDVYGDYGLGPLTNASERLIVVAERAPE